VRRLALEEKGLSINRSKTQYIEYEFDEREQIDVARKVMTINENKVRMKVLSI